MRIIWIVTLILIWGGDCQPIGVNAPLRFAIIGNALQFSSNFFFGGDYILTGNTFSFQQRVKFNQSSVQIFSNDSNTGTTISVSYLAFSTNNSFTIDPTQFYFENIEATTNEYLTLIRSFPLLSCSSLTFRQIIDAFNISQIQMTCVNESISFLFKQQSSLGSFLPGIYGVLALQGVLSSCVIAEINPDMSIYITVSNSSSISFNYEAYSNNSLFITSLTTSSTNAPPNVLNDTVKLQNILSNVTSFNIPNTSTLALIFGSTQVRTSVLDALITSQSTSSTFSETLTIQFGNSFGQQLSLTFFNAQSQFNTRIFLMTLQQPGIHFDPTNPAVLPPFPNNQANTTQYQVTIVSSTATIRPNGNTLNLNQILNIPSQTQAIYNIVYNAQICIWQQPQFIINTFQSAKNLLLDVNNINNNILFYASDTDTNPSLIFKYLNSQSVNVTIVSNNTTLRSIS